MKWKLAAVLIFAVFFSGCATSKYHAAEEELDRKDYDKAIRNYLMMLRPRIRDGKRFILYDKEAMTGIGVAYWHKQSYSAAAKIFEKVLEKDPAHGKALFFLGMSREALDQENEALSVYRRYKVLPDDDPYRYFMFGRLNWVSQQKIGRELNKAIQEEDIRRFEEFPENSVVVTYFLNLSDNVEWDPLQKGLAEIIAQDLSTIPNLVVIDRVKLNRLMSELGLNPVSMREPGVQQRVARILGARYLINGSYLITDDLKMTLDSEIITAETNATALSMNFDGNLARFFKIEKELAMRISDFFDIFMNDRQRDQLLEIPTENMLAFISYCRGLDALDQGNFSIAQNHFHNALRYDGSFINAQDYMLNPKIWEVTQNYNQMRVTYEVRHLVETSARGRARLVFSPPPDIVSSYNRLQWMGLQHNALILPGNNSREPFVEASISPAPVLPFQLSEPPRPPQR
ncbi:tetratricopeptide repeat protein [bacterium]|nr:tetratricopeptide repeat protein [bacterium]